MHSLIINKPRTDRSRETLNRILQAATQVFCEKGYHGSSIGDIAQVAGVAAGTIYVYFESKYTLYKFLLLQCSHNIRKHLKKATEHCVSRREMEEVGAREWLRLVQDHPYMYPIIWESLYVDRTLFVEYYTTFSQAYVRGIDIAKKRGEIRPEIDSDVLAWTLMGMAHFLGLNWGVFKNNPVQNTSIVENFMRILSGGIFVGSDVLKSEPSQFPIRIEVDFEEMRKKRTI